MYIYIKINILLYSIIYEIRISKYYIITYYLKTAAINTHIITCEL